MLKEVGLVQQSKDLQASHLTHFITWSKCGSCRQNYLLTWYVCTGTATSVSLSVHVKRTCCPLGVWVGSPLRLQPLCSHPFFSRCKGPKALCCLSNSSHPPLLLFYSVSSLFFLSTFGLIPFLISGIYGYRWEWCVVGLWNRGYATLGLFHRTKWVRQAESAVHTSGSQRTTFYFLNHDNDNVALHFILVTFKDFFHILFGCFPQFLHTRTDDWSSGPHPRALRTPVKSLLSVKLTRSSFLWHQKGQQIIQRAGADISFTHTHLFRLVLPRVKSNLWDWGSAHLLPDVH